MSPFEAYPEYRDSGVGWIGTVPQSWKSYKFKHIVHEKRKVTNLSTPAGSISFGRVVFKKSDSIPVETKASYQEILPGEYLVNPLNMNFDLRSLRTALSDIQVVVSTGYIVLRVSSRLEPRFVRWLLHQFDVAHMKTLGAGVRQTINFDDIGNSIYYEPALVEQQKIANFLDHETAKIDTLIEKQHQLIKLLKEKRQAVISHAVTKGLNPDAPMKDSGVEWLGEVPEHWYLSPMKYSVNTIEQGWSPQCSSSPANEHEYGVLKVGCVNHGTFNSRENKALPSSLRPRTQYVLKKNDLLISRANSKELVGSAAVVNLDYDNLLLCDKLYRIRFMNGISPHFVAHFLTTPGARLQIEVGASGASSSMQNIGQATILELEIPTIPSYEVEAILEFLASTLSTLEVTKRKILNQLDLLKERRTALISAAVTGKIDVRNWQPPKAPSTPSTDA